MLARKNKTAKNLEPSIKVTTAPGPNAEEGNLAAGDQEMDEGEDWAKSPTEEPSWTLAQKVETIPKITNVSCITKLW